MLLWLVPNCALVDFAPGAVASLAPFTVLVSTVQAHGQRQTGHFAENGNFAPRGPKIVSVFSKTANVVQSKPMYVLCRYATLTVVISV